MSYWLIELNGDVKSLNFLKEFVNSSEMSLVTEREAVCLKVTNLENGDNTTPSGSLINYKNIEYLENLVQTINGAATLLWPHFKRVDCGNTYKVDDNGSYLNYRTLHASKTDTTLYFLGPNDQTLRQWLTLSQNYPLVDKAFYLYSVVGRSWGGLYMVLEVVRDDLGSWDAIVKRGWISEKDLRLFKQTANSYVAVGHHARHASTKEVAPSNPMNIYVAIGIVEDVLKKWLSSIG